MKRYESYKDSGVQWVGKIPRHWNVLPLKYYISFTKGRIPSETTDKCIGYPYLTMDYLRNRNDKQVVYPNNPEGLHLMNEGDILVLWDGANAGEFIKSRKGYLGSTMAKILFDEKIYDKSYFYYLLCSIEPISKEFANGTTIPHFDSKVLVDYAYPCPNLSEQQTIVSYLDFKVGRIESAIIEMEQMLEDIKAYRSSIIREAVTKGLDKNAEMKDSGIEWCGKIPQHWQVLKLGYVFHNLDYLRQPISSENRERNNPQYDYYGASGVIDKIDSYNVDDKVLLIGEDGANLISRTLPLIYKAEGKFWVNNHAHILKPITSDYDYMAFLLESADYANYITGSAQPKLSQEKLSSVKLPVPPVEEQQCISSELNRRIPLVDSSIIEIENNISDLKSYKTSIITEVVTGKVDLREWNKIE